MLSALLLSAALAAAPGAATAADAVTLRDGKVILGQVFEPAPAGKVRIVVRRAWARDQLPEQAKAWERTESATAKRARTQRRARLEAWKRERVAEPNAADPVVAWIDRELDALANDPREPAPLLLVDINRTQVRRLVTRPDDARRMLRQAWRGGMPDPENQPLQQLSAALEARGFAMSDIDRAPIDDLLALPLESDAQWLTRRAATEVKAEPALRYVRYLGMVLPESAAGGGAGGPGLAAAALGSLKKLLDNDPTDELLPKLNEAAQRGRVGVVVTRLDMGEDFSRLTVEASLWVRQGPDRWQPAVVRPAQGAPGAQHPEEAQRLANDPQVQSAFRVFEGLGLGELPADLKQRSLNVGAAVRQALGEAQGALARDLDALALAVTEPARPRGDAQPNEKPAN